MHPRLAEEWPEVLSLYPDATHQPVPERVELSLDLPQPLYNPARTVVAVLIPAGYRAVGLDGFLVPAGLQLVAGGLPASDAGGVGMPGWLLVSFHMMDSSGLPTWRATADPSRGDNFVGYVDSIRAFLWNGCN